VVRMDISISSTPSAADAPRASISISRWVNESLPPWNQLLTAHDVARLTRRHRLILRTLALVGRFPKQVRFQGRRIGWQRSEVLDWLSRDSALAARRPADTTRRCVRHHPRQGCLPLGCAAICRVTRTTTVNEKDRR
jgi:predicted DNA-binding transcriptional regulator AlpA